MTGAVTDADGRQAEPTTSKPSRRPRGWASLYTLGFVLMLAAAATLALAGRNFLASTRPLWVSAGLSAGAIVVSVVGLLLPRRR